MVISGMKNSLLMAVPSVVTVLLLLPVAKLPEMLSIVFKER